MINIQLSKLLTVIQIYIIKNITATENQVDSFQKELNENTKYM